MRISFAVSLVGALAALSAAAQQPAAPKPPAGPAALASPGEIAAGAPASAWVPIAPENLLVIDLAPAPGGAAVRRVVVQLAPAPVAARWVGNIRRLAAAHWWDGTSINRVQDNYVAQWGDASEKKPLPPGLAPTSADDYDLPWSALPGAPEPFGTVADARGERHAADGYAAGLLWYRGFAFATDMRAPASRRVWPVHCYASVGVGRNLAPDAGSGAELYAVIGHAPRHLDRNIAVVGRVIEGVEHLSSLPRGTGALGFYEQAGQRVPIVSARLASDLPVAARPRFAYLATEGAVWNAYATARRNREPPFFTVPAGNADICNIPVPVKRLAP